MTDNCDFYSGMLITVITGFSRLSDGVRRAELGANATEFHEVGEAEARKRVITAEEAGLSTTQATVQHASIAGLQIHLFSCTLLSVTSQSSPGSSQKTRFRLGQ